jgi:hypothetical protein
MTDPLPPELKDGSILRDKEYAWELSAFPDALSCAPALGYACLGGQFWFVISETSLYEPFWLEANSSERHSGEAWSIYSQRSCEEVLLGFNKLLREADFPTEANKFQTTEVETALQLHWMFNAYFVTEAEFLALSLKD